MKLNRNNAMPLLKIKQYPACALTKAKDPEVRKKQEVQLIILLLYHTHTHTPGKH